MQSNGPNECYIVYNWIINTVTLKCMYTFIVVDCQVGANFKIKWMCGYLAAMFILS